MAISRKAMRESLETHSEELRSLLVERAQLARNLAKAEDWVNDFSDELTDDIAKNPEKYGFLAGEKPQNYKIRAIIRQSGEYRLREGRRRDAAYNLSVLDARIESLKMKDADYRCLLMSADS